MFPKNLGIICTNLPALFIDKGDFHEFPLVLVRLPKGFASGAGYIKTICIGNQQGIGNPVPVPECTMPMPAIPDLREKNIWYSPCRDKESGNHTRPVQTPCCEAALGCDSCPSNNVVAVWYSFLKETEFVHSIILGFMNLDCK